MRWFHVGLFIILWPHWHLPVGPSAPWWSHFPPYPTEISWLGMLPPQKYIQQLFLPWFLAKPHPWLSLIFHRLCATTFVAMAGKTNTDWGHRVYGGPYGCPTILLHCSNLLFYSLRWCFVLCLLSSNLISPFPHLLPKSLCLLFHW